jgi:HK97 family phage portal protein
LISEAFSSITPVVEINGEINETHPALEQLTAPNPYTTKKLFMKTLAIEKLVTNECFPVAVGNIGRPPLEIYAISPTNISTNEGSDGAPRSHLITGQTLTGEYKRITDKRRIRFIADDLKEVQHIRGYSTKSNSLLRAESPIIAASREARQHILGNMHNVNLLEKGGRISLLFHFEKNMSPKEFEDAKARVRAQYGGVNSETIGVTAGPSMDIKNIGSSNIDMDFATLQESAKRACFQIYKVPLALLTVEAATLDNYKQAMISLYDWAVLPLADEIFEGLSQLIMPRYGFDPSQVKFTYDKKKITALTARTLEELQTRVDLNLETIDELRPLLGRDEIGGAASKIRLPANVIPIDSEIFSVDGTNDSSVN